MVIKNKNIEEIHRNLYFRCKGVKKYDLDVLCFKP